MAISKLGVYDMMVAETILRLCGEGETALDIGANIGMNTGPMALGVGAGGKVIAYEPHPALASGLEKTYANWEALHSISNIELRQQAISDSSGTATLKVPRDFDHNIGIASLTDAHFENTQEIEDIDVPVISLDSAFSDTDDKIGVMKIDIEGHELAALKGAERLLSVGCIRDIIFEEHELLPTDVSSLLEGHGYKIYLLRKDTTRPQDHPHPLRSTTHPAELPRHPRTRTRREAFQKARLPLAQKTRPLRRLIERHLKPPPSRAIALA